MSWIALFIAVTSLAVAVIAVGRTLSLAHSVSAMTATLRGVSSKLETMQPLTSSSLAALAEMNESLKRGEELLLKVNRREIANAKTRAGNGTFDGGTSKDRLRAMAGLRAGQVPRHE